MYGVDLGYLADKSGKHGDVGAVAQLPGDGLENYMLWSFNA
jgi:hypothetical protein